jgi:hypothetical protein
MVANARSTDSLTDIEPSTTTNPNAAAAHKGIRSHLQGHAELRKLRETNFLSGSYARDIAIWLRRSGGSVEKPDGDIIMVLLPDSMWAAMS